MVAMSFGEVRHGAPIIAADGRLVAADPLTLTPEQEQQFMRWLVVEGLTTRYDAPVSNRYGRVRRPAGPTSRQTSLPFSPTSTDCM